MENLKQALKTIGGNLVDFISMVFAAIAVWLVPASKVAYKHLKAAALDAVDGFQLAFKKAIVVLKKISRSKRVCSIKRKVKLLAKCAFTVFCLVWMGLLMVEAGSMAIVCRRVMSTLFVVVLFFTLKKYVKNEDVSFKELLPELTLDIAMIILAVGVAPFSSELNLVYNLGKYTICFMVFTYVCLMAFDKSKDQPFLEKVKAMDYRGLLKFMGESKKNLMFSFTFGFMLLLPILQFKAVLARNLVGFSSASPVMICMVTTFVTMLSIIFGVLGFTLAVIVPVSYLRDGIEKFSNKQSI